MDANFTTSKPSLVTVGISLSTWIFMYIGLITIRAELHPWVNTVLLTGVYPMYLWYLSKNNMISLLSQGTIIAMVIGALLFMTLLLEAKPKSKFSQKLKKSLKEYGKNPKDTAYASFAIIVSLVMGLGVSYAVRSDKFLNA